MRLRLASPLAVLVLSAPAFGVTAISVTDPSLQGTTIAAETFTVDTQGPGVSDSPAVPVLFLDEKIVRNTTGTLDFYFKFRNFSDPQSLRTFSLPLPASIQASTFYLDEGNLAPTGGSVDTFGNQTFADFSFGGDPVIGPLLGAGGSDTLLVRTDTNSFSRGAVAVTRGLDDFEIQPGSALVPDASSVPEPASLALLSVALVGLSIKLRRQ